jgi:macrodomain Ter protein organizer (MatP/YcbG family)
MTIWASVSSTKRVEASSQQKWSRRLLHTIRKSMRKNVSIWEVLSELSKKFGQGFAEAIPHALLIRYQ